MQNSDAISDTNSTTQQVEPSYSSTKQPNKTGDGDEPIAGPSTAGPHISKRHRSASRSSSTNDGPKSMIDSISATSIRPNWGKDLTEDDPSISSIKGDSISATIADYNRKHRSKTSNDQLKSRPRGMSSESTSRNDDLSVNMNFYAPGSSTSGLCNPSTSTRPDDFIDIVSSSNVDAFDVIEENNGHISSSEEAHNASRRKDRNRRHRARHHHRRQSSSLEIALDDPPPEAYQVEPIIIRGNGNLTLFGLSNSFNTEFPSILLGKVSKEEFDLTMRKINTLLRDQQSLSAKLLVFGGLFCCCSFGFSLLWPSMALKKRSKTSLEKLLSSENSRIYSKLGLNWKLAEQRCYSNHAFIEYVLKIEFTPKINIYLPD